MNELNEAVNKLFSSEITEINPYLKETLERQVAGIRRIDPDLSLDKAQHAIAFLLENRFFDYHGDCGDEELAEVKAAIELTNDY